MMDNTLNPYTASASTEIVQKQMADKQIQQHYLSSHQGMFDSALGGSTNASFNFTPPTHFRGARAAGPDEYWQSGSYGFVTVIDGIGQSYLWIQSTVHDGPEVSDDHVFLMYTQMEDPTHEGFYESFTCQAAYNKAEAFAKPSSVIVRNYYGSGRFSNTSSGAAEQDSIEGGYTPPVNGFLDINFEDLVDDQNAVWRPDTVNIYSSYRSKHNAEKGTSSQTCTALRAVDDSTNFMLKAGSYKFIQGYRVYSSSTSMNQFAKYQGESADIIEATF